MVKNVAAATTAATNASTTTPTNTWGDFRQRLRAMTLLSVSSHSAEPATRPRCGLGWIRHVTDLSHAKESNGAIRCDHRDSAGPAKQVRGRSRDGPGEAGPLPLHLDGLPDRLRLHRGHPRRGR